MGKCFVTVGWQKKIEMIQAASTVVFAEDSESRSAQAGELIKYLPSLFRVASPAPSVEYTSRTGSITLQDRGDAASVLALRGRTYRQLSVLKGALTLFGNRAGFLAGMAVQTYMWCLCTAMGLVPNPVQRVMGVMKLGNEQVPAMAVKPAGRPLASFLSQSNPSDKPQFWLLVAQAARSLLVLSDAVGFVHGNLTADTVHVAPTALKVDIGDREYNMNYQVVFTRFEGATLSMARRGVPSVSDLTSLIMSLLKVVPREYADKLAPLIGQSPDAVIEACFAAFVEQVGIPPVGSVAITEVSEDIPRDDPRQPGIRYVWDDICAGSVKGNLSQLKGYAAAVAGVLAELEGNAARVAEVNARLASMVTKPQVCSLIKGLVSDYMTAVKGLDCSVLAGDAEDIPVGQLIRVKGAGGDNECYQAGDFNNESMKVNPYNRAAWPQEVLDRANAYLNNEAWVVDKGTDTATVNPNEEYNQLWDALYYPPDMGEFKAADDMLVRKLYQNVGSTLWNDPALQPLLTKVGTQLDGPNLSLNFVQKMNTLLQDSSLTEQQSQYVRQAISYWLSAMVDYMRNAAENES